MDKEYFVPELLMGGDAGSSYRENLVNNFDDTRTWVDPNGYRLSDRIWSARAADRAMIDSTLALGIAKGLPAKEVAGQLTSYLNPTTGNGNYAARRLARTEITRALGQGTLDAARRNPFGKGVRWSLSGSHPRTDSCDPNSDRDQFRLGRGVYPAMQTPRYPAHPNCLCTLVPVNDQKKANDEFNDILKQIKEQRNPSSMPKRRNTRKSTNTTVPKRPKIKPSAARKKLVDKDWVPTDAELDDAINVAKAQKQRALQARDDFLSTVGNVEEFALRDPDLLLLRKEMELAEDAMNLNSTALTEKEYLRALSKSTKKAMELDDKWAKAAYDAFGKEFDALEASVNDVGQMMSRRVYNKLDIIETATGPSPRKAALDDYVNELRTNYNAKNPATDDLRLEFQQRWRTDPFGEGMTDTADLFDDFFTVVEDELHRVRDFGGDMLDSYLDDPTNPIWKNPSVSTKWDDVSRKFPTDWVNQVNSEGVPIKSIWDDFSDGAYFQDHGYARSMRKVTGESYSPVAKSKEIMWGNPTSGETAQGLIHEMGHAMDHGVDGLSEINQAFLRRRIAESGDDFISIDVNDFRWKDDFIDTYTGKDYNAIYTESNANRANLARQAMPDPNDIKGRGLINGESMYQRASSEITSTGAQSIFRTHGFDDVLYVDGVQMQHGPFDILADPDYFSHILGVFSVI